MITIADNYVGDASAEALATAAKANGKVKSLNLCKLTISLKLIYLNREQLPERGD
jgi:hypothetical protein